MKFKEKCSSFRKKSNISKILDERIKKLPNNEIVAKDILKDLGNTHTNIVYDDSIEDSFFIYLDDTLYLSKKADKDNNYSRILQVSHECRHTMQLGIFQVLNFISSKIEVIVFIINILLFCFNWLSKKSVFIYLVTIGISVFFNLLIEIDAILSSIKIAKKYLKHKLKNEEAEEVLAVYKFKTKVLLPFYIIRILFSKIIRLLIVLFIFFSLYS